MISPSVSMCTLTSGARSVAVVFFTSGFFAAGFFTAVFFAVDFFVAVFFAVGFFAAVFFAGFFTVDFFAAVFFAAGFFADAFLVDAVFDADDFAFAVFFIESPGARLGGGCRVWISVTMQRNVF
ncbi:hypothetical protein [Nannocystis pusilla]|uniref:hypothetical protein n=1 Tax=Nannocystis pusilla TaxID=889268 RepID=UPI003BF05E85